MPFGRSKMLNRFATVLHNAVDALAPPLPAKEEFLYHWKAVTKFFVDKRSDSKAPIEFTNIPGHLEQMLMLLLSEHVEETGDLGPCMEYLLHHRLLDTLQTLARADCPPGMKQYILSFASRLLSGYRQSLLPHISVYKPMHQLIKLCGEVKAAPTESEEMHFLCIICAKLKEDPSLVNFFLDICRRPSTSNEDATNLNVESDELPEYSLVNSLLTLCQSADSRVSVKACEGLLVCASFQVELAARCLVEKTKFSHILSERLGVLFGATPKSLEPELLDHVEAKWGVDLTFASEDLSTFPGKRQIMSFLSWLDYCDQVVRDAHPLVGRSLARAIHGHFLQGILEPAMCQASESGAILATAWIIKCIKQLTSAVLIEEFGYFLLGESRGPEIRGVIPHPMKQLLIERCSHHNDEVILMTLKLFETLLEHPVESTTHQLVLANLLLREYHDHTSVDYHGSWSDEEDERIKRGDYEFEISPGSSPVSRTMAPSNIQKVINCFLLLLPDELKSCEGEEEMGYENYLKDAHIQFREISAKCAAYDWPQEAVSKEEMHQSDASSSESQAEGDYNLPFYEGSFLTMLFDKMEGMLDQSYDINLQVTSIMSKLAQLPHPNLHELLLNPLIPLVDGCRTLFSCLEKVVGEIQIRIQKIPSFKRKLYLTRRVLLGDSTEYSSVDGSNLLEGLIVLEEFCKELAAIAFVKYHVSS